METNILIYIVAFAVAFMFIGVAYYIGNRYFIGFRLSNMEKKVTDYFTNEGYEWKKEDGVLNVKRQAPISESSCVEKRVHAQQCFGFSMPPNWKKT